MKLFNIRHASAWLFATTFVAFASSASAITLGQVDTFPPGPSPMGWRGNTAMNFPNTGPLGLGDSALKVDSIQRMVVVSDLDPANEFVPTQWTGNYTAAGVTQISLDVRNPNSFDMQLFLGIADGTVSAGGSGATYITDYSITIPADNAWRNVSFSVTASDFVASVSNTEETPVGPAAILSNVYQLRLFHSTIEGEFRGDEVLGHFFVDNITAESAAVVEDADFDGDADVDGIDFLIWQRNLGIGATQPAGDADFNNVVNALDLSIWKSQFGTVGSLPAAAVVPEPAAVGMVFSSWFAAMFARRLDANAPQQAHS